MLPLYHGVHADPATTVALTAGLVVVVYARERLGDLADRVRDWRDGDELDIPDDHPDPHLYREYVTTDMAEAEYERRLEAALDPQQSRALAVLDAAEGIGDERALAIAAELGSVETIAAHEPAALAERVDGIGETLAERAVRAARGEVATA
jgi:hypothetical protein